MFCIIRKIGKLNLDENSYKYFAQKNQLKCWNLDISLITTGKIYRANFDFAFARNTFRWIKFNYRFMICRRQMLNIKISVEFVNIFCYFFSMLRFV